ncbi:MAG: NADH-quinone oxidoreductase subunit C [Armatimonadetes bacterium]|nr:NADH-quinone oxidoreductase subunit C [Armatimonadota bacterium]
MSETTSVTPESTSSQPPAESLVLRKLRERFPDRVLETHTHRGDATAVVPRDAAHEIFRFLKEDEDLSFEMLTDLTAVDYLKMKKSPRFEVVYHLYSLTHNHRVRIKIPVTEAQPEVDSIVSFWSIANWYEREVWDMFGIRFRGHPDLRRILLYEEFKGHPLRKDYPKNKRQPLVTAKM